MGRGGFAVSFVAILFISGFGGTYPALAQDVEGTADSGSAAGVGDSAVTPSTVAAQAVADASRGVSFEKNLGQWDERALYRVHAPGADTFITADGLVTILSDTPERPLGDSPDLSPHEMDEEGFVQDRTAENWTAVNRTAVFMTYMDALPGLPAIVEDGREQRISNYLIGNDPTEWVTNVPHFQKITLQNIYQGIDVTFYGDDEGGLKYDFIVRPGSDPRQIQLEFDGHDRMAVQNAELVIHTDLETIHHGIPYSYARTPNGPRDVHVDYVLEGDTVQFEIAAYDSLQVLVIDPVVYSTYLGGTGEEVGLAVAVDASGNAYVSGYTRSANFPTTSGAYQTSYAGATDAFVAKLDAFGTSLAYSTYLGGTSSDFVQALAVDASGNAYVSGHTESTDFPTTNGAYQTSHAGGWDAFVAKLGASGTSLAYSTYLGGTFSDLGYSVAVDDSGNAYVSGYTSSTGFPTTSGAYQTSPAGHFDAFAAKLDAAGSNLLYSTYLGGTDGDFGHAIAVDASGNAYVSGRTTSTDFPTTSGAYQTSNAGVWDAFTAKLDASGSSLLYSTYLGGTGSDRGYSMAVDASGNAYVHGDTSSTDFPTTNGAYQTSHSGEWDAFVAKLDASGSSLAYSTYLGGTRSESPGDVAVDASGNAYVTSGTNSPDFPTTSGAYQTSNAGGYDAFVAKLDPSGSNLAYSTYLGGTSSDAGKSVAVEICGNAYVSGHTSSPDFPTTSGAYQASHAGSSDAFLATLPSLLPRQLEAVSGPGPRDVSLSWQAPLTAPSCPIDTYHVYRATALAGPYAKIADLPASQQDYVDGPMSCSTDYFYKVTASGPEGEIGFSNTASVTTPTPVPPGQLEAVNGPGPRQISLTWQEPLTAPSCPIDTYHLYRATALAGPYAKIADLSPSQTDYVDGPLESSTSYFYKVTASGPEGETGFSNTASATIPQLPGPPQDLEATTGTDPGTIDLTWNPASAPDAYPVTAYRVYRSSTSTGTPVAVGTTAATTFTDQGLETGPQFYRVRAINAVGESLDSNEASAMAIGAPLGTDDYDTLDYRHESASGQTPLGGVTLRPLFPAPERRGSVNLASGEFIGTFPILRTTNHRGEDFVFEMTYRSIANAAGNESLTWGWDANWFQRLEANGTDYDHFTGDGRIHQYTDAGGSWEGPPGSYKRITTVGGKLELEDRDGNRKVFDPVESLRLTDVYGAAGSHWVLSYSSTDGTLTSILDPHGHTIALSYDTPAANAYYAIHGQPLLTSITAAGRTATLIYDDASGRLVAVRTPSATTSTQLETEFVYSDAGRLQAVSDPLDREYVRMGYDDFGRTRSQLLADGPGFFFDYYHQDRLTFVWNGVGHRTEWRFLHPGDSEPRVVPSAKIQQTNGLRLTDPDTYTTTYEFNAQDEVTRVEYPRGNAVEYEYDETGTFFARGNLLSETQTPGAVRTLHDQDHHQESITTRYEYDPTHAAVTKIIDPRGNDPDFDPPNGGSATAARYTTRIYYDFEEATLGDLNGDGITSQTARRPVKIEHPTVNPPGSSIHAAFTSAYSNQAGTETFTWNAQGQLLTHTNAAGTVEARTYHTTGTATGYLKDVTVDSGSLNLKTTYAYNDFGEVTSLTDPNGNVQTFDVDDRGRVTQETGPSPTSYRTKWTYDANDNVIKHERETDSGTDVYTVREFQYNALDQIIQETVHAARSSTIAAAITGQGTAPAETYTRQYAYDNVGNLIRSTGAAGGVKSWSYDERNLLLNESGPEGGTYSYDANGNLAEFTDPRGNVTRYQHDGYDRRTVRIDALGNTIVTGYDSAGHVVRERGFEGGPFGPLMYERRAFHDEAGQEYQVDALHEVPAGAAKALTTTTLSPGDPWVTTLTERDARGLVNQIINDNGHATAYAYDDAGRRTKVTDPIGNMVEHTYDANGNVASTKETDVDDFGLNPETYTTAYTIDSEDRVTQITNPDATTRTFTYDGRDNVVTRIDEAGGETSTFYDHADRPWVERRKIDASTNIDTTTHWDAEDRPFKKCDDLDLCTTYGYVPATRLVSEEAATHVPGVRFAYDTAGNRIRAEHGNGKAISVSYDELHRRTAVNVTADADTIGTLHQTFAYDGMGRIVRATDDGVTRLGTGVVTALSQTVAVQRFDTLGRVVTESQNFLTVHHTRDGVGNIVATAYPTAIASADLSAVDPTARIVHRSFDATERTDRVWDVKGLVADYAYQGDRVAEKAFGGPASGASPTATTTISYDTMRRPDQIDHEDGSGTLLAGFKTRFDSAGNRVAEERTPSTASDQSQLFTLDSTYRTTNWKRGTINAAMDTISSPVDESGWGTIDGRNEWSSWTPDGPSGDTCTRTTTSANALEETCGTNPAVTWQRDANGNVADDGTYEYHWDFLNRLVRVEDKATGDLVVGYGYDAFNRRIVKVFPGQEVSLGVGPPQQGEEEAWYTWSGQQVVQESLPVSGAGGSAINVNILRQWTYGPSVDEVLEMSTDVDGDQVTTGPLDVRHYYHMDALNTVIGLTDESGDLVEGYSYKPYGDVVIRTPGASFDDVRWNADDAVVAESPSGNVWFFTGRQLDPETGTYHYRARNYDPYLGQFLSMDPMGIWGDPANLGNPYAYVGNNPFNSRDPYGLWCLNVFSKACREENVRDATQLATDTTATFVEAADSTVNAAVEVASVAWKEVESVVQVASEAWEEVESVTAVAKKRVSNAVRESVRTASVTATSATNAAQTHVRAAGSADGTETQGFLNPGEPSITISAWFLYGGGITFSGEGVSAHVSGSPSVGMTITASSGHRDKGRYHAVGGGIGGAAECSFKDSADPQVRSDSASCGLGAGASIGVPYSYQYQSRTVEWFWRD